MRTCFKRDLRGKTVRLRDGKIITIPLDADRWEKNPEAEDVPHVAYRHLKLKILCNDVCTRGSYKMAEDIVRILR